MMPAAMTRRRRVLAAGCILAAGLGAAACGSEDIKLRSNESANVQRGAVLFAQRCQGCHTMAVAGAQGGAMQVHDRERADGPNFDVRRETTDSVLYAIRNGGFSGAIMPENIVVGQDAADVAAFVSKYAGGPRKGNDITPESQPAQGNPSASAGQDTTSTGQDTTSTGQDTTSTPENTTSTPENTTSTPENTTSTPENTTSTPQNTTSTPESTTSTPEGGGQQAAANGKQIFTTNCAGCHTLKDANASGKVGPDLDQLKPDQQTTERQVTNGGGAMPAFKGQLEDNEITAVSQYVASVAGK
jgi:mono/diheme cytochrome c family protein